VAEVSPREFRALAEFRYQLRRFLSFSEAAAKQAGVEPQQHQLMLAVKAKEPEPAGIAFLAERLQLRHHSVVGLVDRLEASGLVRRKHSASDRRTAQVELTAKGERILHALSLHHREELRSAIPDLIENLSFILQETESKHHAKSAERAKSKERRRA
jgi:DNA-binding MarR family transcriptional regulator